MDHSYFTEREKVQKTDHSYFTIARKTPAVVLRKAELQKYDQAVQVLMGAGGRPPVDQDHSYTRVDLSTGTQSDVKFEVEAVVCDGYEEFGNTFPARSASLHPLMPLGDGHSRSSTDLPHIPSVASSSSSSNRLASLCLAAAAEYNKDRMSSVSGWDYSPIVVEPDQELWISMLKRFDEEKPKCCSSFDVAGDNFDNFAMNQSSKEQRMDVEQLQLAHTTVDHLDLADFNVNYNLRIKRNRLLDRRQTDSKCSLGTVDHIDMANCSSTQSFTTNLSQDVDMSSTVPSLDSESLEQFNSDLSKDYFPLETEIIDAAKSSTENQYSEMNTRPENEISVDGTIDSNATSYMCKDVEPVDVLIDRTEKSTSGEVLNPMYTLCSMDYTNFNEHDTIFIMEGEGSDILRQLFDNTNRNVTQRTAAPVKELDGIDSLIRDISLDHTYDMCLTPKPHRRQCPSAYTMISEAKTAELAAARQRQKMSRAVNSKQDTYRNSRVHVDSESEIEENLNNIHCSMENTDHDENITSTSSILGSPVMLFRGSMSANCSLSSSLPHDVGTRQPSNIQYSATTDTVLDPECLGTYAVMKEHNYLSDSQNINKMLNTEVGVVCGKNNFSVLVTNQMSRRYGSHGSHLDDHSYLSSLGGIRDLDGHNSEHTRTAYDDLQINATLKLHDHTYLTKYNADSKLSASRRRMSDCNDTESQTTNDSSYDGICEHQCYNDNVDGNSSKDSSNKQMLNIEYSASLPPDNEDTKDPEMLWNLSGVFETGNLTNAEECADCTFVKSSYDTHSERNTSDKQSVCTVTDEEQCDDIGDEMFAPANDGNDSQSNKLISVREETHNVATRHDGDCDSDFGTSEEVCVGYFDLNSSTAGVGLRDHSYHVMVTNVAATLSTMTT